MSEILKLAEGLKTRNISFEMNPIFDGAQIKCEGWDAVCHSYSYGGDQGLLETMGLNINDCCEDGDGVQGFLKAEDILSYLDNMKEE